MAGCIIPIMAPRLLDFSGLTQGSSLELVLRHGIDVTQWMAAGLMVRVSKVDLSGGNVFVTTFLEGLTPDDPGAIFVEPVDVEGPVGVTIDSSIAVPFFQAVSPGIALGPAIRVVARGSRTAASGNVAVTMSVDVCLKNGV